MSDVKKTPSFSVSKFIGETQSRNPTRLMRVSHDITGKISAEAANRESKIKLLKRCLHEIERYAKIKISPKECLKKTHFKLPILNDLLERTGKTSSSLKKLCLAKKNIASIEATLRKMLKSTLAKSKNISRANLATRTGKASLSLKNFHLNKKNINVVKSILQKMLKSIVAEKKEKLEKRTTSPAKPQISEQVAEMIQILKHEKKNAASSTKIKRISQKIGSIFKKIGSILKKFCGMIVKFVADHPLLIFVLKTTLMPIIMFSSPLIGGIICENPISQVLKKAFIGVESSFLQTVKNIPEGIAKLDSSKIKPKGIIAKAQQKILSFMSNHPTITKLANIATTAICIGATVVVGSLALSFAAPFLLLKIWDTAFGLLIYALKDAMFPKLGELAKKYPIAVNLVILTISATAQLIIGIATGLWVNALINIAINFGMFLFDQREALLAILKKIRNKIPNSDEKYLQKIVEMEDFSPEKFDGENAADDGDLELFGMRTSPAQ
ncbi:MAG: hypothetical protein LBI56_02400 [Puniceicoccales bacterium]|jgi:hypothetical protein|nr:hypothetical protein [Puniceicoccales bacterium]